MWPFVSGVAAWRSGAAIRQDSRTQRRRLGEALGTGPHGNTRREPSCERRQEKTASVAATVRMDCRSKRQQHCNGCNGRR
jgi:hypothetical protein